MPALSPTMSQGNIASWQVSEGVEITAGDVLADIETDKATLAWENQDDGFVAKLLKPSGSKDIPVGTPLIVIVEDKEYMDDFKNYEAEGAPAEAAAAPTKDEAAGTMLLPMPQPNLLVFFPLHTPCHVTQHRSHTKAYMHLQLCLT